MMAHPWGHGEGIHDPWRQMVTYMGLQPAAAAEDAAVAVVSARHPQPPTRKQITAQRGGQQHNPLGK
jgi:hypothetical protein